MKRVSFALILIVFAAISGYGQNSPKDLILLLDTSASMSASYLDVSNYLSGAFLRDHLRIGDTFHFIPFSGSARVDIARRIEGRGELETIIGRMFLQYPLDAWSDIPGAINFAEIYAATLPSRPKKIVLITDGIVKVPPSASVRPLDAAGFDRLVNESKTRMGRNNTTLEYVKVVPGQPLPQAAARLATPAAAAPAPTPQQTATAPRPATGQQQPSTTQQPPTTQPPAATGQQQPTTQQPTTGQQQPTTQQPTTGQQQPSTTQPPATSQQQPTTQPPATGQQSTTTQPPATGQQQQTTTQPPATGQQQQTTTQQQPTTTQPPATGQQQPTTTQQPATGQQQQTTTQPPATGQQQQTTTQQPATGTPPSEKDAAVTQTDSTDETPESTPPAAASETSRQSLKGPPIGLFILLGCLGIAALILIIFFISRELHGRPNRTMAKASAPAKKETSGETKKSADHSKDLATFAASQSRQRTSPYADRRPTKTVQPENTSGPMMINLFVEDQNTFIGKRNIHSLKPGISFTVGGGGSDYLIFLVPIPQAIGIIRRDGDRYTFIPKKPQYFPDLGSQEVPDCIGQTIRVISDKNYELRFHFEWYEDPLKALNKLLNSINLPGKI